MIDTMKYLSALFLAILFSMPFVACEDEEGFSSDPSLLLEFSSDTITFDTLFTDLNSPSAGIVVHNRHGDGIRISSVELASGGTSGFSVLVDGQYGDYMRDLEVRANDSIFVLASVHLERNDKDIPFLVKDSLLFNLESGVQQKVLLMAYGRDVIVMRGETVAQDTVIAPGHYVVHDSLVVAENVTLGLSPGTTLYFHDKAFMKVYGTLDANGTLLEPVVLRGDRTDRMFPYLPYDRIPGQWEGVTFAPTSNGNRLQFCDIHSANYGVKVEPGDPEALRIAIESSKIHNFHGNALELIMSHASVVNSLLANAQGNCVKVVGGDVSFIHCTIANFYVWKQRDVALALHNSIDGEPAPLRGALFANCVIAGSKSDEVMGYLTNYGDTIPDARNYRFENSLINTVAEGDSCFVNNVFDNSEEEPFGAAHFRKVDHDNFVYDFHLSDSATAKGIAAGRYSELYRFDIDGVERPAANADAGCYQYVEMPVEEDKE